MVRALGNGPDDPHSPRPHPVSRAPSGGPGAIRWCGPERVGPAAPPDAESPAQTDPGTVRRAAAMLPSASRDRTTFNRRIKKEGTRGPRASRCSPEGKEARCCKIPRMMTGPFRGASFKKPTPCSHFVYSSAATRVHRQGRLHAFNLFSVNCFPHATTDHAIPNARVYRTMPRRIQPLLAENSSVSFVNR